MPTKKSRYLPAYQKPDEFVLDQNEKWLKDVKVNICYKNLSNFKTFFINPNTDHYLEGKRIYKDNLSFSRQEVKISSFRMMRVKNILEIYQERFYEVFRLRHLHWSIFIAVVFHLYVFLCDFNNLHLHFLYLVLIVMGCNYPAFRTLFVDSLFERLRSPKTQNPDFWEPLIHTKTYLKEHRYMQIDLLRKRLKPAEGLLTTMNSLYNKFNDAPFLIHKLVNVFEKLRNLLLWYEPRKSLYFLGFILFLIWVCYLIPLKILILLGFWGELNDQRNYYKRHYARNMQVASQAIRLIIAKTMDKYADISTDFSRELPFVANDSEFSNFRKKLNAKIDKHLDIELPDNLLQTMHKLDDLVHFLASTNERLKVLEPEILEFDNSKYKKKLNPFLLMMIGFVQTTPSDYFAIVNNKKI